MKKSKVGGLFLVILGALLLWSNVSDLFNFLGGGSTKSIDYIPYAYGEIVSKENTVEGSKFSLPEGVEIIITEQSILTKEDIENQNPFNDFSSDVAVLSITINNNSDKEFDYNIFGIEYASTNNIQLDYLSGIILDKPAPYDTMEDFSSGTVMPNNTIHKIKTIAVPDNEKVKTIYWDYFGNQFTIELP